ncbi:MAG: tetratricopeptide repeat protein [Gemmatimonadetes bacterium]|nr:tetratricopeptide repeat protein [Gemmatimonadota bacterium]
MRPAGVDRRLAAILAADVVGYSRLMGDDDEGTLAKLKTQRAELIDPKITQHNGRIVKTTGDGMLVEFPSVVDALRCAVDVQESIAERHADVPLERRLQLRVGINLGDVIVENGDIFGDGVNVASRLEGLAEPGGICISQAAHDLVRDRCAVEFQDLGDVNVKNIARPIHVYRVVLGPAASSRHSPVEMDGRRAEARKSIAVLPFVNVSSDPENEFFSDGVSEELINLLTRLPQLRVASRTSSFSFKGKSVNVRAAARDLGVNTILEGSVRRAGTRIRITAQLIDAESDSHLWSETYDRQLEDIFAVQDEIAHRIVDALEITLSPKQERIIHKAPTTEVQAYEYYLRGRMFFYQERGGVEMARQMFARAIEIDPGYALAYAGVADAAAFLYMWYDKNDAHLEQAEAASRRALELDPELAEAHAARGHVLSLERRYDEAEREFETAIRLDPRLFEGYYFYARDALSQGKLEKAARLFEQASEVRPEDYQAPTLVVQVYRSLGREAEALDASRRCARIVEKHVELNPDDHRALVLGAATFLNLGDAARGRAWADRAYAISPENPGLLYNLACFHSRIGDVERSLDLLEKSATVGIVSREWVANDSDLDAVRSHPRFQALLKRLG